MIVGVNSVIIEISDIPPFSVTWAPEIPDGKYYSPPWKCSGRPQVLNYCNRRCLSSMDCSMNEIPNAHPVVKFSVP